MHTTASGIRRCGGPTRWVTSSSRIARRILSPTWPLSRSTSACNSQFRQRQRQPQRQLPASNHLELLHGLPCLALIWVPHSGSPLVKRLITPNSIRVQAESRCFFLRFQLKEGHAPAGVFSRTSVSLDHVVERNRSVILATSSASRKTGLREYPGRPATAWWRAGQDSAIATVCGRSRR